MAELFFGLWLRNHSWLLNMEYYHLTMWLFFMRYDCFIVVESTSEEICIHIQHIVTRRENFFSICGLFTSVHSTTTAPEIRCKYFKCIYIVTRSWFMCCQIPTLINNLLINNLSQWPRDNNWYAGYYVIKWIKYMPNFWKRDNNW